MMQCGSSPEGPSSCCLDPTISVSPWRWVVVKTSRTPPPTQEKNTPSPPSPPNNPHSQGHYLNHCAGPAACVTVAEAVGAAPSWGGGGGGGGARAVPDSALTASLLCVVHRAAVSSEPCQSSDPCQSSESREHLQACQWPQPLFQWPLRLLWPRAGIALVHCCSATQCTRDVSSRPRVTISGSLKVEGTVQIVCSELNMSVTRADCCDRERRDRHPVLTHRTVSPRARL